MGLNELKADAKLGKSTFRLKNCENCPLSKAYVMNEVVSISTCNDTNEMYGLT